MNLSSLLSENVERCGEYPLLHYQGETITNRELEQTVNRVASGLSELGVQPGDRVALVMGNSPELVASMFACFKIGAWAMPVVLSLKPYEFALILDDAEPTTLIAQTMFCDCLQLPEKKEGAISYKVMVGKGKLPEGWMRWDDWLVGQNDRFQEKDCEPDDVALLLYTSGTTGSPKGVLLSHMNLYSNAMNSARSQGLKQGEKSLAVLPLNHSFGITAFLASVVYGMEVVLMPRFDPVQVMESIARFQVEGTAMVPTMLAFMLECPDRDKFDLKSLKKIVVGAAPLSPRLRERFEKEYPHVRILEAYGLTEAGPAVTVTRPDQPDRPGSVGQSLENQEVCIMSPEENILGPGQVGEVCTRGPHVMAGYYHRPRETAEAVRDGWLHTGDAGYLDRDGYLYLTERMKDLIIRGGENVYPSDVESVLRDHYAVKDCAVVGVPHEIYGEEVVAVVVKKQDTEVTAEELLDYCRENLAPYQVPTRIIFSTILPKTPMGKVRKKDLRNQVGGMVSSGESS
ncbi:MAG: long-chain-fatty-acid--CoA ligase [bacterium]